MWKILDIIFGTVAVNRIRLRIGNTKRNPLTQLAIQFKENYLAEWNTRGEFGKFFLVVLPLTNLFIFSGVFSFLLIITIDFFFFRYIINSK